MVICECQADVLSATSIRESPPEDGFVTQDATNNFRVMDDLLATINVDGEQQQRAPKRRKIDTRTAGRLDPEIFNEEKSAVLAKVVLDLVSHGTQLATAYI